MDVSFQKSRLQAVSFFESFEYLEEYEEGKNGEMIKAQLDDDPLPDTPLARPDYLECSCRHKNIHIDKKLLAQGAECATVLTLQSLARQLFFTAERTVYKFLKITWCSIHTIQFNQSIIYYFFL